MTLDENSGKSDAMKNLAALTLAALLPLAACGGGQTGGAGPALICPQVAVLQQGQTLSLFLPGRADMAARITTAQMAGITGFCEDRRAAGTVLVKLTPHFIADDGPANHGARLTLVWFAAIIEGDAIIHKYDYTQTLDFAGSSLASATGQPVRVEMPDTLQTASLSILTGFEETPDERAYAAAHPGAAP